MVVEPFRRPADDESMKALFKYRPDLRACELEDRLLPVTPSGAIVLTTGGYALLLSPFPVIAADPFGATGGLGFLTPSAVSGSGGVSGLLPGNSASVTSLVTPAPTGTNGGGAVTIVVGSGANDSGAVNIPPVTRNTIANDALTAAPVIGRVAGDQPPVLPPEQVYRDGLPVNATVGYSSEVPGQRAAQEPAHGPVGPLPLRIQSRPHGLASGASGNLIRSHTDRRP
jgi:hypothetical protein